MTDHKHLPEGTPVYIVARGLPKASFFLGEILERVVVKTTPTGYKVRRPTGGASDLRRVKDYFITESKLEAVLHCLDKVEAYIKREQDQAEVAQERCEQQVALANEKAAALRAIITCSEVSQ